jgi:hypothetical protein
MHDTILEYSYAIVISIVLPRTEFLFVLLHYRSDKIHSYHAVLS